MPQVYTAHIEKLTEKVHRRILRAIFQNFTEGLYDGFSKYKFLTATRLYKSELRLELLLQLRGEYQMNILQMLATLELVKLAEHKLALIYLLSKCNKNEIY